MFSLEDFTKVKVLNLGALSQKNRPPNSKPGAQLTLAFTLSNHILSELDGRLLHALYERTEAAEPAQASVEGVEPITELPNLTGMGRRLHSFRWDLELTGYTLVVDWGRGGASNLVLSDAKVDGFTITPKEGGTVILKLKVEVNDVPEATFGKLATLKSRETEVTLTPPEAAQQQEDVESLRETMQSVKDSTEDEPADATEQFLDAHGGDTDNTGE